MSIPEDGDQSESTTIEIAAAESTSTMRPSEQNPFVATFQFDQIPPTSIPSAVDREFETDGSKKNLKSDDSVANKYFDSPCTDAYQNIEKIFKKQFRNRSRSETEIIEMPSSLLPSAVAMNRRKMSQQPINDLMVPSSTLLPQTSSVVVVGDTNYSVSAQRSSSTNPFAGGHLHKTLSETYLEQMVAQIGSSNNGRSASQTWQFGRSLSRQGSNMSLPKSLNSSQNSLASDGGGSCAEIDLKRAMSCDSVNSESSVVLADLEPTVQPCTGMLCVGLQYDK